MVSCLRVCEFRGRAHTWVCYHFLRPQGLLASQLLLPHTGAQHPCLVCSAPSPLRKSAKSWPWAACSRPSVLHPLSRLRYLVVGRRGALLSLVLLHKLFSQFSTKGPKPATTLMKNKTITSQRLLLFLPLPSSEAMKHRASVRSDSFIHSTNVYSQSVLFHELFWGLGVPS